MDIVIIVISILLIILVLLQSGKGEASANLISGGDLFANRKERGGELFFTRLTAILGIAFMVICFIQGF